MHQCHFKAGLLRVALLVAVSVLLTNKLEAIVTTIEPADTLSAVISLVSGESRAAIIDGFHIIATLAHDGFFLENSSPVITNCRIDNCRIAINANSSSPSLLHSQVDCSSPWPAIRITESQPDSIQIIANSISNALSDAIIIDHTSPVRITGNNIHDSRSGICAIRPGAGSLIARNVVCRMPNGSGIYVADGGPVDVSNNTCYDNAVGITISQSSYTRVTGLDNIIVNSTQVGLYDAAHHIHNTLLWNNTVNFANPPQLPNDYLEADPLFRSVDDDDFSLLCESPAIDVGEGKFLDPDGSRPDFGAVPTDHTLNAPSAINLAILGEDPLQVLSPNPTFAWSVDTASIVTTIADTIVCYVDPLNSEIIVCDVTYTDIYSDGKQIAYEFQLGTNADWTTAELMATGEVTGDDSSLAYNGAPLIQGGQYYARLRIKAELGWGCWRNLVFKRNSAPVTPTLASPKNNVRVNAAMVVLRTDKLIDLEGDLVFCEIQLFDDSLLATPIFTANLDQGANSGVATDTLSGLIAGATYYWRARAYDNNAYSDWSNFTWFRAVSPGKLFFPENYATLHTAVTLAIDGDSIIISPGAYEVSNVNLHQKALTFIGTSGADSTILWSSASSSHMFYGVGNEKAPTTFCGIQFTSSGALLSTSGELVIRKCRVFNTGYRNKFIDIGGHVIVDGCEFGFDSGWGLIAVRPTSLNLEVVNSTFHTLSGQAFASAAPIGAYLESGAFILKIENNVFSVLGSGTAIYLRGTPTGTIQNNAFLNHTHGIECQGGGQLYIRNNIFVGCSEFALGAPAALSDYNCYWNNTANYSETAPGAHDIIADPLFVDAANGDYHLQCNSPCIDAGDPAAPGCFGKSKDVGAFEYDFQVGNANGNLGGVSINMTDVVFLINYIFLGGNAPCPLSAGRIDCNDSIDVSDAVHLLNYLFAHGAAPCAACP